MAKSYTVTILLETDAENDEEAEGIAQEAVKALEAFPNATGCWHRKPEENE